MTPFDRHYGELPSTNGRRAAVRALGSWKVEFWAFALALAFLAAIFITLAHFNGKDVPSWLANLNLNSLVAIYATSLRALLLYAITEIISQEKWYWFCRPRPLRHLDDFDFASRGGIGSFKLLRIAFRSTVPFLAALTTIVLLAIGPFSQQAIKTTLCNRVINSGTQARIPFAAKLPQSEVGVGNNNGPRPKSPAALNAIKAGLTIPSVSSADSLLSVCPTGNCTFPEFRGITHSSLGLCSTCEDLTSMVVQLPRGCPLRRPNGTLSWTGCSFILAPPDAANATIQIALGPFRIASSIPKVDFSTGRYANTVPFDKMNVTLLARSLAGCNGDRGHLGCPNAPVYPNLTALQDPIDFNFTLIGTHCSFFPCIKHYQGEIRNSHLLERVIHTTKLTPNFTDRGVESLVGISNPCLINSSWYDSSNMSLAASKHGTTTLNSPGNIQSTAPRACIYHLQNEWMNPLAAEIDKIFTGGCEPVITTKSSINPHADMFCPNWWLDSLWNDGRATFETIAQQFDNVASAVTNHMRSVGLAWDAVDGVPQPAAQGGRAFVLGTTEETFLCIRVDWVWLLLPAGLTVATLALLVAAVVRTRWNGGSVPAWKSSVLPLLFHGFRGDVGGVPPDHRMEWREVREAAGVMTVTLVEDEKGGCGMVIGEGRRGVGEGEGETEDWGVKS
ncbi:hypothetical protein QBC34DRAFT_349295 [Podospora aff. communis PSN243]|uniref:Uncharacterized protein n=1 Tax=Podospora aff. communis PSN243 TaxID=3040156 RepID=A0AAV9GR51_9PEZI|nr:hypothetical protein QBC34DRAFT_349295 [Podospora aff. communis PSN243]